MKYDVVLSNPPFNSGWEEIHKKNMTLSDEYCLAILPSELDSPDIISRKYLKGMWFPQASKNEGKCVVVLYVFGNEK